MHTGIVPVPKATSRISYGTVETTSRTITVQRGYQVGYIRVYLNGAYLPPDQYTATDGSTIDFGIDLPAGTDWIVDEARTFVSADHYDKGQSDQRYSRLDGGNDYTAMPTVNGAPIVESGSNSDGTWVKWADGTLQCRGSVYLQNNGTGAAGSKIYNFPEAFILTSSLWRTSIQIALNADNCTTAFAMGTANADSATTFRGYLRDNTGAMVPSTSGSQYLYLASGRWK